MPRSIEQYKTVNNEPEQEENPYKVVQLLLQNIIDKLTIAIGCIKKNAVADKGNNISLAITIIDVLQASLDMEQGGKISEKLLALYTYMVERLVMANLHDDITILEEVIALVAKVKEGWDGIEDDALAIIAKGQNNE